MSGWPVVALGDVCSFVMGQAPPGKSYNSEEKGTLFVKAGEFGARFPRNSSWTTQPLKFAQSGDVLVCVVGATIGKVNFGVDCAIGRSVAALRPRSVLETRYLYYFMCSRSRNLNSDSQGSAQGVIGLKQLSELEILLPPLDEQKRIVAKLDEAGHLAGRAAIAMKLGIGLLDSWEQQSINNIFKSVQQPTVALEELVEEDSPITYGVIQPGTGGTVPLVRSGDLKGGVVTQKSLRMISPEIHGNYPRTILRGDEVLIALVGVPGAAAVAPQSLKGANIARQVAMVRTGPKVLPEYVATWLNSRSGRDALAKITQGSVQQVINLRDLRIAQIPVPSVEKTTTNL